MNVSKTRDFGYWQERILRELEESPDGFELNPQGWWWRESDRASRRRAAYRLEELGLISLRLGVRKGRVRQLLVLRPDAPGASQARAERLELARRSQARRKLTIRSNELSEYKRLTKERLIAKRFERQAERKRQEPPIPGGTMQARPSGAQGSLESRLVGRSIWKQFWRRPTRFRKSDGEAFDASPSSWIMRVDMELRRADMTLPGFYSPVAGCVAYMMPCIARWFRTLSRHPGLVGREHRLAMARAAILMMGTLADAMNAVSMHPTGDVDVKPMMRLASLSLRQAADRLDAASAKWHRTDPDVLVEAFGSFSPWHSGPEEPEGEPDTDPVTDMAEFMAWKIDARELIERHRKRTKTKERQKRLRKWKIQGLQ